MPKAGELHPSTLPDIRWRDWRVLNPASQTTITTVALEWGHTMIASHADKARELLPVNPKDALPIAGSFVRYLAPRPKWGLYKRARKLILQLDAALVRNQKAELNQGNPKSLSGDYHRWLKTIESHLDSI